MQAYVARMLQRKARRDKGIQFDNNQKNDVPVTDYPFAPERLDRYLGWLAVRLKYTVGQHFRQFGYTAFSGNIPTVTSARACGGIILARAPLVLIAALVGGACVAPLEAKAWCEVILLGVAGVVGYIALAGADMPSQSVNWKRRVTEIVSGAAVVTFVGATIVTTAGIVSVTLSLALPGDVPPIPAGVLAIMLVVTLAFAPVAIAEPSWLPSESKRRGTAQRFVTGSAGLMALALALHYDGNIALGRQHALTVPAGFQILFALWTSWPDREGLFEVACVAVGSAAALVVGSYLYAVREWYLLHC